MHKFWMMLSLAGVAAANAQAAGHLLIEHAWIRNAPPGAMMFAGYAILRNEGDTPVTLSGADSVDFGNVSLHQSVVENGVERMRALGEVTIVSGASVEFSPGGKHFMLMRPTRGLKSGDTVKIHIAAESGEGATGEFVMSDVAP